MFRIKFFSLVVVCLTFLNSQSYGNDEQSISQPSDETFTTSVTDAISGANREPAGVIDEAIWPTIWRDLKSPFNSETRGFTFGGIGLTTLVSLLKNEVGDPLQDEITHHRPLGSMSRVGDDLGQLIPNVLYAGGFFTHYYFVRNDRSARLAMLMTKATFYSGAVTTFLKYTIREPRPNNKDDRNSFPSGHATSAFAFASVVGAEHGWKWGVPAYLMASFVGLSRINDNKHLLQDVIAGATVGISYGLGLYFLDHPETAKDSTKSTRFLKRPSVAPFVMPGLAGLSLRGEF